MVALAKAIKDLLTLCHVGVSLTQFKILKRFFYVVQIPSQAIPQSGLSEAYTGVLDKVSLLVALVKLLLNCELDVKACVKPLFLHLQIHKASLNEAKLQLLLLRY